MRPDPSRRSARLLRPILLCPLLTLPFSGGCKKLAALQALQDDDGGKAANPFSDSANLAPARTEIIVDPSLAMNAAEINVPGNWHFSGTLLQSGNCVPAPFPVFRATSPDGLSFYERLPVLGWAWGTGPAATVNHNDCLPLKEAMSAQDFLKYISATLDVEYVADDPVPADVQAKVQKALDDASAQYLPKYAAMHTVPPTLTRQIARAFVRFVNGSFTMKGRLATTVDCTEMHNPGMKSILRGMADFPAWNSDTCQAAVTFIAAPEAQFPALATALDADAMQFKGMLPDWSQAWMARNTRETAIAMQKASAAAAAQRQASAAQFAHDQAVRQHMHEQFLATMQRGTNMSMARARDVANSNHRSAQDWVDYSLDRQTVRDPNTGQISKVSSAHSYTWVDSSGKTSYQTNDPNANPNGALKGTWTRQQVVHGDGTN